MEVEAQAARHYWQSIAQVIPPEYGFRGGRDQEGKDPFNLMLNYGYGVLRYMVEKALLIHGFDPYAGFLHADRSGKPSLTLDVMEPLRPVIDKALVFAGVRVDVVNGFLSYESRASIIKTIMEEFQGRVYLGARPASPAKILNNFVEELASYLRGGDTNDLDPPVIRWGG